MRCRPPPPAPLLTQYNVENHVKLQALVFNIKWGVGDEVMHVKLYMHLAFLQKRQKHKFVPRLLSMIVANLASQKELIKMRS